MRASLERWISTLRPPWLGRPEPVHTVRLRAWRALVQVEVTGWGWVRLPGPEARWVPFRGPTRMLLRVPVDRTRVVSAVNPFAAVPRTVRVDGTHEAPALVELARSPVGIGERPRFSLPRAREAARDLRRRAWLALTGHMLALMRSRERLARPAVHVRRPPATLERPSVRLERPFVREPR